MNPTFCQKNCALNWNAYLNGCVFKWEVTVQALNACLWKLNEDVAG